MDDIIGFHEGNFASANFLDAEDARPSGAHMEALGGTQDAIQGIVQQALVRHTSEGSPQGTPPTFNWRKRLREMMVRQNETVLAFLYKPVSEHPTVGPVEQALRRFAIRQDIDYNAIKTFKQLLDISGTSSQRIMSEIETCVSMKGPSTLVQLRSQIHGLIDLYKETGERLLECEAQLKMRLEKMDKIQRRVSTVIELQTNDAMVELVEALEKYMKLSFRDMGIETHYVQLLYLYQKHIALRDAIQVFKAASQSQEPLCPICLTDPVGAAIVPCGHTFCQTCSRRMTTECGVCRGRIRERIKLYFG